MTDINNYPYLEFDGENLKWMENGRIKNSWRGMSGHPEYQNRKYQSLPLEGPLPEGNYLIKQNNYQEFDDLTPFEKTTSTLGGLSRLFGYPLGKWPGGRWSWGNQRVWIEPQPQTNTYGRNNFSIHGGTYLGSAGCIDLADEMEDFAKVFRENGEDIEMIVKYPNASWWKEYK